MVFDLACEGIEYGFLCEGRCPLGHVGAAGGTRLAGYLAGAALLEAARVDAFAQLARQCEARGAPAVLVERRRQAARRATSASPPSPASLDTHP